MATKIDIKANVQSNNKDNTVGEKSLKTLRTYQLGVVYKDKYGRETPVLTNEAASFTIPKRLSSNKNSISTSLRNDAPDWADSYKFFVKETSNEYYNACMDRWYDAEDGNIWLSFPSAERNKIQEDTFIILKKKAEAGLDAAVLEEGRYRVIDVRNEAPDFIKTNYEKYGQDTIEIMDSAIPGSSQIQFDFSTGSNPWNTSVFFDDLLDSGTGAGSSTTGFIDWPLKNVVLKLEKNPTGETTNWMDVANMYKEGNFLYMNLSKGIPSSSTILDILPTGAGDVQLRMAKKVVKDKTEFDGRFFVKVRRDGVINDYIRSIGNTTPNFNVHESIKYYWIARSRPTSNSATPDDTYWATIGENWFIDDCDRSRAGGGWGAGSSGPWHSDSGYGLIGTDSNPTGSFTTGVVPQNNERGVQAGSNANLRCTMELSIQKILDYSEGGYNFSNNDQGNQKFADTITSSGTQFRFKEDPFQHIYKIISPSYNSLTDGTNGSGIHNYSSKNTDKENPNNKSGRMYLKFKTTGWRLNVEQGTAGAAYTYYPDDADKYPFGYYGLTAAAYAAGTLSSPTAYAPPLASNGNSWNPRAKGFGSYANSSSAAGLFTGELPHNASSFTPSPTATASAVYTNTIQIIEQASSTDGEVIFATNPAIWETEPREDIGLDIYYEASQAYPLQLSETTNELFAPYGCTVTCDDKQRGPSSEFGIYIPPNTKLVDWSPTGHGGDTVLLGCDYDKLGYTTRLLTGGATTVNHIGAADTYSTTKLNDPNNSYGLELKFTRLDGSYTTAKVRYVSAWDPSSTNQGTPSSSAGMSGRVLIKLNRDLNGMNIKLPYFNCYSFGNGVESDRIRDDFNAVRLDKGVKVSTVLDEPYEEEQRTNGLIYSGIYNSMSGVNNLNQFIAGEKITKDVNPNYGSIQKLKTRDTNLIAFCEDKVLKIVANKDALYNADGQPQLIASNKVLGNTTTFAGEFGISKNPESFASESFRMYFTDKQRGKVLRLSGDGITPISSVGMQDWFADNLKNFNTLVGSFDDRKQEYNLSMINRAMPSVSGGTGPGVIVVNTGGQTSGGVSSGSGSTGSGSTGSSSTGSSSGSSSSSSGGNVYP